MELKLHYKDGVSIADLDNKREIIIERELKPSRLLEYLVLKKKGMVKIGIGIGEETLYEMKIFNSSVRFDKILSKIEKLIETHYSKLEKLCDSLFKKAEKELINSINR
jgi:hypothetical protein